METLEYLRELAVRYPETKISVRLVKGAYWDAEIKQAQLLGADSYPVWTEKRQTDVSYLACASFLLENSDTLPMPAFATHNARTVADILSMVDGDMDEFTRRGCEFQRLHGMGESFDYCGLPVRVWYCPWVRPTTCSRIWCGGSSRMAQIQLPQEASAGARRPDERGRPVRAGARGVHRDRHPRRRRRGEFWGPRDAEEHLRRHQAQREGRRL